jgi:photosystem II stability/assembly factor-like uncharacterized protein/transcriptional regulator with XRE-family HTH domain
MNNQGERLKAIRNDLRLTQKEFGDECGVARATIGELENDSDILKANSQRFETLSKIEKALGLGRDVFRKYLEGAIDLESLKRQQLRSNAQSRLQFNEAPVVTSTNHEPEQDSDAKSISSEPVATVDEPVRHAEKESPAHDGPIGKNPPGEKHISPTRQTATAKSSQNTFWVWVLGGGLFAALLVVGVILSRASKDRNEPRSSEKSTFVDDSTSIPATSNEPPPLWKPLRDLGQLHFIHVADSNTAWVTGLDGVIIATQNGFKDWTLQNPGTTGELQTILFANDRRTGWVVGAQGTILHTNDGGERWSPRPSGTKEDLRGLYFSDDWTTGWAVGAKGTILQTTDAGQSWHGSGSRKDIGYANCILFVGNRGWIGGEHGTLSITEDGGKNWHHEYLSENRRRLWGIHLDSRRGWVVGDDGEIFMSHDGKNWELLKILGITAPLHHVQFIDSENGWIVGDGIVLRTQDGGKNWNREQCPDNAELFSIHMIGEQVGWAVGGLTDSGQAVILKHTQKGWTPIE